ncbi:MAG: ATP-binding cassette domain-containing protein [Lachnospiraceae bacterium]|nr:ATP-binding cassette domain-containing protein [Lachnospiraceae bacterium]
MGKEIKINTEDLSVGYGKKVIIEDINISVKKGEILVLIGPNGAGKSTVLKTIASQLKKITGTVTLDGYDVHNMKEKDVAKKLSLLLTMHPKGEMMTVEDIVETGRYPFTGNLGMLSEEDKKIVADSITMIGLSGIKDKFFESLSDGQKQRVMLARAICRKPEVLVLDEPTSYLDIRHKLELLSILKKLAREKNIAVVMSLHELDLVGKCADNVLCIRNGRIDRYGTIDDVFYRGDNYINELYGVKKGTFIETFGSMELEKSVGEAKVFVIGGGGYGITVYRHLQRKGIPFATGVISENDMEYPIANALAATVVAEKAFEPVSEESIKHALEIMKKCEKVINALPVFGTMNEKNKILLDYAKKNNMLEED